MCAVVDAEHINQLGLQFFKILGFHGQSLYEVDESDSLSLFARYLVVGTPVLDHAVGSVMLTDIVFNTTFALIDLFLFSKQVWNNSTAFTATVRHDTLQPVHLPHIP